MRHINFTAPAFSMLDGYGSMAMRLTHALANEGFSVTPMLMPILDAIADGRMEAPSQRMAGVYIEDGLTVQLAPASIFVKIKGGRSWGYSMWEDTAIPKKWSQRINATVERIIVPCEYYQQAFRENGVTVPVHVVHGGTEPADFPLAPDRGDRPFTFLCLGDRGVRKGTSEAVNAFRHAFQGNRDVRLVIKTRAAKHVSGGVNYNALLWSDSRISLWQADVSDMSHVYRHADCYVYPSYGDGWGKTPREAVCMGIPTIVPRHSGLAVGIDNYATRIIETCHKEKSYYETSPGYWLIPDTDELVESMRWVYEHQDEARAKAQQGAEWIRNSQTWQHSARQFKALVERLT